MRFFRKNTTKPAGGRPVEREIGILFDIEALGGLYGKAAYRILFDVLDPHRLAGCSFHDGDTDETLRSRANVYCIAIRSSESRQIDYVRQVMDARPDAGLLPPGRRFLEGNVTDREPLVPAGAVSPAGKLVVPPDQMIQKHWGDGTAWTVVVGTFTVPVKPWPSSS